MSATTCHEPTLPDIPLSELEVVTKDYLIAYSAHTGRPISEIVSEALNSHAETKMGGER